MDKRWGVLNTDYWLNLGWSDVRHRYRRTLLGPLWLVIPLGAMVFGIGLLYSQIFEIEPSIYVTHLTLGIVPWLYLAQGIIDASGAFISHKGLLHATRIQKSALLCRIIFMHFIFFLHNLLVAVAVILVFGIPISWPALAAILSVVNITIFILGCSLFLSPLAARFYDVQQMLGALLQLLFFLTPIIWMPSESGARNWQYVYNPLYHLIEGFRTPILYGEADPAHYLIGAACAAVSLLIGAAVFSRTEKYVTLWSN